MNNSNTIWTIGHSTRSIEIFLKLLDEFQITLLADIRAFPGSRRFPHFNKENLLPSLEAEGIQYMHMRELGGRRKTLPNSMNTAWRNASFRGYADYMQTESFKQAIDQLIDLGSKHRVA